MTPGARYSCGTWRYGTRKPVWLGILAGSSGASSRLAGIRVVTQRVAKGSVFMPGRRLGILRPISPDSRPVTIAMCLCLAGGLVSCDVQAVQLVQRRHTVSCLEIGVASSTQRDLTFFVFSRRCSGRVGANGWMLFFDLLHESKSIGTLR